MIIVILLNIVRLGLSTWLFVQGARWLIYTEDIEAIILNGVALAFVRDIDGMIFAIFVPSGFISLWGEIKPLPVTIGLKRPSWSTLLLSIFCFSGARTIYLGLYRQE